MKILFWTERYLPDIGGVEVLANRLMNRLSAQGHTFNVVTSLSPDARLKEEVIDGVTVRRFSFHKPLFDRDLREVGRLCRLITDLKHEFRPDVIHMNTTQPSIFYHVHTLRHWDCPTVVTIHSPPSFVDGPSSLYGKLVRSAERITAVSDSTRMALARVVPEIAERMTTIHNGLEWPGVEPAPVSFDPVRVMVVGRIVKEKGIDVAIKAFRGFRDVHQNATLTIVGDGPERPGLEKLAGKGGLESSVEFVGWVAPEKVPEVMNTASMVLVPSRWEEPFGLVALQALQVARPVIASRIGGLPEVVSDGKTGILVEPDNAQALCNAMLDLAADPDRARRLGAAARLHALDHFSIERCADQYNEIYRSFGS